MEIKPLAYTESLNLKWFILNSTNHKMRSFITSRERKLFMQLHNALCELLWVSHKAVVTHSLNRCKGDGQDKRSQGCSAGGSALPMACHRHTARRQLGEGKVLHLHCPQWGQFSCWDTEEKDFYHRYKGWKFSNQSRSDFTNMELPVNYRI